MAKNKTRLWRLVRPASLDLRETLAGPGRSTWTAPRRENPSTEPPAQGNPDTTPIGATIDQLIKAEAAERPEQLRSFFDRVLTNYDEAIRMASRYFLGVLTAWFLTYAIADGWIDKIEILGLELKGKMVVASPFLIGLLSYGMLSSLAGAAVFWDAICRSVSHLLPTARKHDLDDLLAPPTFSNIERMLEPEPQHKLQSLFSTAWFVLVTLLIFCGSLGALAHTTLMLFNPCLAINRVLAFSSAVLGATAWLRGNVLLASAMDKTGGFSLRHRRGSGLGKTR
jgi:hypothetical protein